MVECRAFKNENSQGLGFDIAGKGFFPLWKQTKNDFCGRRRQTKEKPARSGSVKGKERSAHARRASKGKH